VRRSVGAWLWIFALTASFAACRDGNEKAVEPGVAIRAGLDHSAWEGLLQQHVNERGLVAYSAWKASPEDLRTLREYLGRAAAPADPPASGDDQAASLINTYNALVVDWILQNYPTPSIQSLPRSFKERRHTVGGRKVSLDDIEHATLRPFFGYRVHGALVCAARSCAPLRREAYAAARLDQQLDRAMREWLDREDLNRFDVAKKKAEISSVFKWFPEDFEKAGGLRSALKKHARGDVPRLLDSKDLDIDYMPFDWSLNDLDASRTPYRESRALRDRLRNLFD
jgi:hypothetical protein